MKNEIITEQIKNMSYAEKRNRILRTAHFFKYLMLNNLEEGASIIKLIIEEATGLKTKDIILSDVDMPSCEVYGKTGRLDLRIIDDKQQRYAIEVLRDYLDEDEKVRFQVYLAELLINSESESAHYLIMPPVYVICLLDKRYSDMLIDHYMLVHEDEYTVLEDNRTNLIFINLSYIDTILKTKSLSELSVFEKLVYLFNKGLTDDLLKMNDIEVNYIMDVYERFESSEGYSNAELEMLQQLGNEILDNFLGRKRIE